MKRLAVFIVVVCSAVVLSGCKDAETPVVRIGHAPHDHHAPLYVAVQNPAYFKKKLGKYLEERVSGKEYVLISEGEEKGIVKIHSGVGGMQLIRKLHEKQTDVTFGGVPAILKMIDSGSPMRIIAPVNTGGAALVGNIELPVEDWEGFLQYIKQSEEPVRVGYKIQYSVQNIIFEEALELNGISFSRDVENSGDEVVLMNLHGAKNLLPAMRNGLIDFFVVMQPFPAEAVVSGDARIISKLTELPPKDKWNEYPCCALASREDFIAENLEIIEDLKEIFAEAAVFIKENPYESSAYVSKWLGTSVEVEEASVPNIDYRQGLDESYIRGVNIWAEIMADDGLLTGTVKRALDEGSLNEILFSE
ncbi:ABC transporter substrate-binding protein [Limisalsivibrio acetivorans]|uniref:ABC transporter substrate-binding protein n=1 Tax=Limisalsivibrio acetivorans TaxID=1304888 RepID=UPI0003B59CAA|nr:ABC transporter substrate-binding protein [Limisalsivibrio acetivorans]